MRYKPSTAICQRLAHVDDQRFTVISAALCVAAYASKRKNVEHLQWDKSELPPKDVIDFGKRRREHHPNEITFVAPGVPPNESCVHLDCGFVRIYDLTKAFRNLTKEQILEGIKLLSTLGYVSGVLTSYGPYRSYKKGQSPASILVSPTFVFEEGSELEMEKMIVEQLLAPKPIQSLEPVRVLTDCMVGLTRFQKGQIVTDEVLIRSMLDTQCPVVPVSDSKTTACAICSHVFEIDPAFESTRLVAYFPLDRRIFMGSQAVEYKAGRLEGSYPNAKAAIDQGCALPAVSGRDWVECPKCYEPHLVRDICLPASEIVKMNEVAESYMPAITDTGTGSVHTAASNRKPHLDPLYSNPDSNDFCKRLEARYSMFTDD